MQASAILPIPQAPQAKVCPTDSIMEAAPFRDSSLCAWETPWALLMFFLATVMALPA